MVCKVGGSKLIKNDDSGIFGAISVFFDAFFARAHEPRSTMSNFAKKCGPYYSIRESYTRRMTNPSNDDAINLMPSTSSI